MLMNTVVQVKLIDLMILFGLSLILMAVLITLLYIAARDYYEWRRYRSRPRKNRNRKENQENENLINL